jgi:hypothetical protein
VVFDKKLLFNRHYDNLRTRALKRLNIIKIFSHKSWGLSPKTLKCIYTALVGSICDYSFFTLASVTRRDEKKNGSPALHSRSYCLSYLWQNQPSSTLYLLLHTYICWRWAQIWLAGVWVEGSLGLTSCLLAPLIYATCVLSPGPCTPSRNET